MAEENLANDFVAGSGSVLQFGPKPEARWIKNIEGKWGLCSLKDMKMLVPFVCDTYLPGGLSPAELKFGMATAYCKGRWHLHQRAWRGLAGRGGAAEQITSLQRVLRATREIRFPYRSGL